MSRFAAAFLASPVFIPRVYSKEMGDCENCKKMKRLPKAHELPIYDKDHGQHDLIAPEEKPNKLEEGVHVVRAKVTSYFATFGWFWDEVQHIYNTGYSHTKSTYDYVTEDANIIPRILTIFSGGVLGVLLGTRRGAAKKIVYGSTGMGLASAAVYPSQTKEYVKSGFNMATDKADAFLKDNTGIDVKKVTSEKVDALKSVANTDKITEVAKEWIHKMNPFAKKDSTEKGDIGQSNPKDSDLYTTRKEK